MGAQGMRIAAVAAILAVTTVSSGCGGAPSIDEQTLPWPSAPAAVGYLSGDEIVAHGDVGAQPIASLAKVVSALVVLERHPLEPGEPGPAIAIDEAAVADAHAVGAAGGIVSHYVFAQDASQHDLLTCSLIASASDCSQILARWAFGSDEAYLDAAAEWLSAHGLDDTVVTDASGIDGGARGTTADMVRLGRLALADPVVAEIVGTPQTDLDGVPYENTNELVSLGFTGIKTGTDRYSHLLFSRPAGDEVIVGVVLGAANAAFARRAAVELTDALLVARS